MTILGIWSLDHAIGLVIALPLYQGSWNLDLSDLDCRRALSDEEGQELERVFGGIRIDEPPDRVTAEEARRDRRSVTQWA